MKLSPWGVTPGGASADFPAGASVQNRESAPIPASTQFFTHKRQDRQDRQSSEHERFVCADAS